MKPVYHLIASASIGTIFLICAHSFSAAIIALFSGFFIDIDHFFDHLILERRRAFNLKNFFYYYENLQPPKLYFVFHSIEFVLLLWLLTIFYDFNLYILAFTVGVSQHIFLDLFNLVIFKIRLSPYFYFMFYRIFKGFNRDSMILKSN